MCHIVVWAEFVLLHRLKATVYEGTVQQNIFILQTSTAKHYLVQAMKLSLSFRLGLFSKRILGIPIFLATRNFWCMKQLIIFKGGYWGFLNQHLHQLNPRLVHPVALAINKKNETPLFATVFVVLSTLHYYMFRPT
jgi:hypothetical protein